MSSLVNHQSSQSNDINCPTGMSVKVQPLKPCLPNFANFSDIEVTMELIQPRVIGVGTTCYVMITDNRTVLKGYQVWSNENLIFDFSVTCEERAGSRGHKLRATWQTSLNPDLLRT